MSQQRLKHDHHRQPFHNQFQLPLFVSFQDWLSLMPSKTNLMRVAGNTLPGYVVVVQNEQAYPIHFGPRIILGIPAVSGELQ